VRCLREFSYRTWPPLVDVNTAGLELTFCSTASVRMVRITTTGALNLLFVPSQCTSPWLCGLHPSIQAIEKIVRSFLRCGSEVAVGGKCVVAWVNVGMDPELLSRCSSG
jgi:hypothetical protein